jgi:chitin disaccharide deacetylase
MRRVIISADDFGLSVAVNEGIEQAHSAGILGSASLMVAAPAAADAVARARRLPGLKVGLHLVVIEGASVLPHEQIPDLVGARGLFSSHAVRLGMSYFFRPKVRHQLAAEIRAQFQAFAGTGLRLDHANAHKHMHLHPTVGRLLIEIGAKFGLRAIRIPAEPAAVLAACGCRASLSSHALHGWTNLLRRQANRADLATNDHVFGIAWSGHMTAERVLRLLRHLPEGVSEIYFHPATRRDPRLGALMPAYEHGAELATLLDSRLRDVLADQSAVLTSYSDLIQEQRSR